MKIIFLIITSSLLLLGCSSTYKISDFSSKDEFYDDINKSTVEKNVKVTLINDSSFNSNNGVQIINDTLYSVNCTLTKVNKVIAQSDIRNITYTKRDFGDILLKNNEQLKAENIKIVSDSVKFIEIKKIITRDNISNINKIKEVFYKNHGPGIIPGIILGIPLMGLFELVTKIIPATDDHGVPDDAIAVVYGGLSGVIVGGVIGWIIGFNYTYQFTP